MAHPRMYRDDDPYLTDLRRIALAFPEAAEVEAWGRPTFRAGKKMFAIFEGSDEHPFTLVVKPEPGEREALLADSRFFSPRYHGAAGWVSLDLTVAPVSWDEVGELLDASYRQVALRRMLVELDATGG